VDLGDGIEAAEAGEEVALEAPCVVIPVGDDPEFAVGADAALGVEQGAVGLGIIQGVQRQPQHARRWPRLAEQHAAEGVFGDRAGFPGGSSLMSLLGLGNIGESLGLTGPGGLLSSIGSGLGLTGAGGLLGATAITGWGTSTSAALGAMGGAYGPASLAQLQAFGGGGLFGGTGATFGSLLGGAGAGFGAGMLLNSLLGGNQTGGMVGSGAGALAGAALGSIIPGIGTLIGGLLGGAAGGGLGGLFGPGPSVQGWGLRLQSAGRDDSGRDDFADRLLPVSRQYYNESGAQMFAAADQVVAATNAYLASRDLQVGGVSILGGNKNGADYSWADAGNLNEAFSRLRFGGSGNADLDAALAGRTFTDLSGLQSFVEGLLSAQADLDKLGTAPMPAFTQQIDAINAAFDKATETARTYGLAEEKLATERARQIAALEAQRTETLRQGEVALAVRRLPSTSTATSFGSAPTRRWWSTPSSPTFQGRGSAKTRPRVAVTTTSVPKHSGVGDPLSG
jgi:hypothetical protein